MRSGYCHSLPKHCFVVSGRVEVWSLCEKGTNKTIYNSGSSYDIPEYVPHILHFLEDTVTMEWWTSGLDFRCWFYHPYRRLVRARPGTWQKQGAPSICCLTLYIVTPFAGGCSKFVVDYFDGSASCTRPTRCVSRIVSEQYGGFFHYNVIQNYVGIWWYVLRHRFINIVDGVVGWRWNQWWI